ncbi:Hypothetical protein POVR2_LOCUS96 [uncultured virus]|nr:Hypothetical protein POVR2_LOCUS96 [uncultured virus]
MNKSPLDNNYWYLQTQELVRCELKKIPSADWKRIYDRAVVSLKQERDDRWMNLDYLPYVLFLEDVYGPPLIFEQHHEEELMNAVQCVEVLDYLARKDYVCLDYLSNLDESLLIWLAPGRLTKSNKHQMLEHVFKHLDPQEIDDDRETMLEILMQLADKNDKHSLALLAHYGRDYMPDEGTMRLLLARCQSVQLPSQQACL